MADDTSVQVKIVGDASGVAPAVEQATTEVGGLKTIIGDINAFLDSARQKFVQFGTSGGEAGKIVAAGAHDAMVAVDAESNAITRMIMKVHEGAESVRTFQMRAKEFAEVYVGIFAVETVAEWVKKIGEAAEKTEKMAAVMGMTVGQVQALSGAATMSGTSIDALQMAMMRLNQKTVTVEGSTTSGAKALKAMGIASNDGRTNLERLMVVADKFHNMADGPKKNAIAMELFGRNVKDTVPFLNQGSKAIEEMMEKSKELGLVNEAAVEQGARLASSVNESKVAWEGLKNTLTQAFGPVLTELVDGFVALVKAMVDSYNSGGIVKVLFDGLSEIIKGFIEIVYDVGLGLDQMFNDTKGSGEDWGSDIKDVVNGIVDLFKNLIAACVFVADAFIATWDIIKGSWLEGKAVLVQTVGAIKVVLEGFVEFLKVCAQVFYDSLHLSRWGDIVSDWNNGMEHVQSVVKAHADAILAETGHMRKQATDDFNAAMALGKSWDKFQKNLFSGHYAGPGHDAPLPKFGGGGDDAPDIKGSRSKKPKKPKDDIVQKLEQELQDKKNAWNEEQVAQDQAQQYSLESEAQFWKEALKMHGLSAKDRVEITKKMVAAEMAVQKQSEQWKLEDMKEAANADGKNLEKKKADLQLYANEVKRFYGAESSEARAAAKEIAAVDREIHQERLKMLENEMKAEQEAALFQVDKAQEAASFEEQMGVISKGKLIALEQQFENKKYAIDAQALQQRLQLLMKDPTTSKEALQALYLQIEALKRQHEQKMTQLTQQAVLQRTQIERQAIGQVSQAWGQGIGQMLTGQVTFRDGLIQMWQGLVSAIGNAISTIVQQFIEGEITKLVFHKTAATSKIATEAALAGAGGVASMAAAPFPMDMTAPAFGASMSASAMSFVGAIAAEGGDYHVREGLYHLHEEEMVLPAWAAKPLRSLIEGGSSSSGGGAPSFMLQPQGSADPTKSPASDGGGGGGSESHFHYSPTIHHSDTNWDRLMRSDAREARRWFKNEVRAGRLTPPER